jgi:hypothetical protein
MQLNLKFEIVSEFSDDICFTCEDTDPFDITNEISRSETRAVFAPGSFVV